MIKVKETKEEQELKVHLCNILNNKVWDGLNINGYRFMTLDFYGICKLYKDEPYFEGDCYCSSEMGVDDDDVITLTVIGKDLDLDISCFIWEIQHD